MLKYIIIGLVILSVVFLLIRALGRRPEEPVRRELPKTVTPPGEPVAAEIDGQEFDIDPVVLDEVSRLVNDGQKTEAIKRLHEATGLGLKEANDVVESLERLKR